MEIAVSQLTPGDPRLVEAIVSQLKSKGIFDRLRKECLADVDTKPAFLNLKLRVDSQVKKFLETKTWKSDLNKNHFRDGVRKNIQESSILDSGIDAIINQVVNPKIKPLILPYVEDTVYGFLQIDKPTRVVAEPQMPAPVPLFNEPPPLLGPQTMPPFIPHVGSLADVLKKESNGQSGEMKLKPVFPLPSEKIDSLSSCESEISVGGGRSPLPIQEKEAVISQEIIPMETDVISSEEDDILVRSSTPEKSDDTKINEDSEDVGMNEDNAVDSFDSARKTVDTNAVISGVENLNLKVESDLVSDIKDKSIVAPLFDNRTLDSISSNSSGLSFSPLSAKNSVDELIKHKSMEDVRSSQSTPLEDEKSPSSQESSDSSRPWPSSSLPKELSHNRITIASFGNFGNADKVPIVGGASPVSTDISQDTTDKTMSEIVHSSASTEESQDNKSTVKSVTEGSGSSCSNSNSLSSTPEPPKQSSCEPTKEKSTHSSNIHHHHRRRSKSKDRDKHHSKSSKSSKSKHDDHSSHRDKDKKYHRRDRDDDKDRDKHSSRSHHSNSHGSSTTKSTSSGDSKERREKSSDHNKHKSRSGKHDHHKHSSSSRNSNSHSKTPDRKSDQKRPNDSKNEEKKKKIENVKEPIVDNGKVKEIKAVNGQLIPSKTTEKRKISVIKEDMNFLMHLNNIKKKIKVSVQSPTSSSPKVKENVVNKMPDIKVVEINPKLKDGKLLINSTKLKDGKIDKLLVYSSKLKDDKSEKLLVSASKLSDGKNKKLLINSPKLKEDKIDQLLIKSAPSKIDKNKIISDLKKNNKAGVKKIVIKTANLVKKRSPCKKIASSSDSDSTEIYSSSSETSDTSSEEDYESVLEKISPSKMQKLRLRKASLKQMAPLSCDNLFSETNSDESEFEGFQNSSISEFSRLPITVFSVQKSTSVKKSPMLNKRKANGLPKSLKRKSENLISPAARRPLIKTVETMVLLDSECSSDSSGMDLPIIQFCQSTRDHDFEGFERFSVDQKLKTFLSNCSIVNGRDESDDEENSFTTTFSPCKVNPLNVSDSSLVLVNFSQFIGRDTSNEDLIAPSMAPDNKCNMSDYKYDGVMMTPQSICSNSMESEMSKNGASLSDCSQQATEIFTRSKRTTSESAGSGEMGIQMGPISKKRRILNAVQSELEESIAKDNKIVVGSYSLLTPEEDRTSTKEYEVDYQRGTSYSPLSPASDSSGEEPKLKSNEVTKTTKVNASSAVRGEP